MDSSISNGVLLTSAETQFAKILENFQLSGGRADPFDVIRNFTSIAASRALAIGQKIADNGASEADQREFESWDLEAKLWHLVEVLYSFRFSDQDTLDAPEYASLDVKKDAYLSRNNKVKELLLIIDWLQYNAKDVNSDVASQPAKWTNTKVAIESKNLSSLAPLAQMVDYVDNMDADAPLRSQKQISPLDKHMDDQNFAVIYKLVLKGDVQRAIDYASETGNFTMALILVGSRQDYVDPVLDGDLVDAMDEDISSDQPGGIRHKYMWYQTVSKLALATGLTTHEKLIYSFLCGGDQSEGIEDSGANWEQCLLLYLNQLYTLHIRDFLKSTISDDEELSLVNFPTPPHSSIEEILNSLLKAPTTKAESASPLRVILGSVMINQLNMFLHNTYKSNKAELMEDAYVLRVLVHLAVVSVILNFQEGNKTVTKFLTSYISMLSEQGDQDLVPVYLAFIPDEKDVRECYSIFLSTITDPNSRARQLELFKRLGVTSPLDTPNASSNEDVGYEYENKINNVLKRTVERVMAETEPAYDPQGEIKVEDKVVDQTDITLYQSVEWLFENKMYEDAINASRTVIRRFLLTGRLKSILAFSKNKAFRTLLNDYDLDLHTKSMSESSPPTLISEDDKEELMQYDLLVETLRILQEWKTFTEDANAESKEFWSSKDVAKSIEKTIGKLHSLIFDWFSGPISSCSDNERVEIYKEYRNIYVPYFIIELLQVLQQSRHHDWKYIHEAFDLVNAVANDKKYDLMNCFISCGRLGEFVTLAGDVAYVASERGIKGIFA